MGTMDLKDKYRNLMKRPQTNLVGVAEKKEAKKRRKDKIGAPQNLKAGDQDEGRVYAAFTFHDVGTSGHHRTATQVFARDHTLMQLIYWCATRFFQIEVNDQVTQKLGLSLGLDEKPLQGENKTIEELGLFKTTGHTDLYIRVHGKRPKLRNEPISSLSSPHELADADQAFDDAAAAAASSSSSSGLGMAPAPAPGVGGNSSAADLLSNPDLVRDLESQFI